MPHYCKYHALELADWNCGICRVDFCSTCSPDLPGEEVQVHYCPLCNNELKRLGSAHSAAPFWQRLTDFLRYPLSPIGVALLLLAFVFPLLLQASDAVIFSAAAAFLLVVMKYAWTSLEKVANGDIQAVGVEHLSKASNNDVAFGLGGVLVLFAGITGYVFLKSAFYGSVLAAIFLSVVPAMLIAAGTNRSLNAAVSGEGLQGTLRGVGPVYVAVALLSLLLFAGLYYFVNIFADILPLSWGRAMALTAYTYFILVLFSLCGYVVFQFQESLGFSAAGDAGKKRKTHKRGDPLLISVEMFLKEGNYAKAISILKNETQKKSANLTTHERYHKLVWAMNDEAVLRQHGDAYFKVMLENGRESQAVSLLRSYMQRIPGYRPEDPDVCFDLAVAFERMGEYKFSVHVLNGLHKDSPHYVRLPDAYLLAATVLAEKLSLPQKGLALVQYLDGRFKTHKNYPEIQRVMRRLVTMMNPE